MRSTLNFFRATFLWILLLPIASYIGGCASNQLVLFVNHDTFPVSVNLAKAKKFVGDDAVLLPDGTVMLDDTHCLMTNKTHLNLMADIFDFHDTIESVGDLMIDFGTWMWSFAPFLWGFAVLSRLGNAIRPSVA